MVILKTTLFLILSLALAYLIPINQKTYAAKKFTPKGTSTSVRRSVSGSSLPSQVRYRPDRNGVLLSFLNFNGISQVNYTFTYLTNGNPQGAGGTITAANNPTTQRELLFGTCSTGVCTYHYNLSNAVLTLTAKKSNGTTITKRYRIKTYH